MVVLKLLGGAILEGAEGSLSGAVAQRQRLALLALLALSPTGRVGRDKLLGYLWPELDEDRARHALSNSLYIIKKALGEESLVAVGDDLQLNRGMITVDVLEFEEAIEREEFERAAGLFSGPLLDGVHLKDAPEFEKWLDGERARLSRRYAELLEILAERAAEGGETKAAADWWRKLAVHDPYDSRIALSLMQALVAAGKRAEAIEHSRIHALLLKEHFEADPDPTVLDLAESLRSGSAATAEPAESAAVDSPVAKTARRQSSEGPTPPTDLVPEAKGPEDTEPVVATPIVPPRSVRRIVFPSDLLRSRAARWIVVLAGIALLFGVIDTLNTLLGPNESPVDVGNVGRPTSASDLFPNAHERPSVAVLPFDNISPDPADAYFADGMHDEIITQLAKISSLTVISRTSVMQFRGREISVPEIARQLGASAILEGSARRAGGQVRITAQLIDGQSDVHLWADQFDRELVPANVLEIQSEIAQRVAAALETALTADERERIAAVPTDSLSAYEYYLKGWQSYRRYRTGANENAIGNFRAAIGLDPEYALAWAGLANAYAQRPYRYDFPVVWYDSAEAAALRSIELDPRLGEGWKALGLVYTVRGWVGKSIEAYQKALKYSPSHDGALNNLGMAYYYQGAYDRALFWTKKAARVAPTRAGLLANVGSRYLDLGELRAAERWIEAALDLYPEFPDKLALQELELYWARGDLEGALRRSETAAEADPANPRAQMRAARAAIYARRYERALSHVREATRLAGAESINPHWAGVAHLMTGGNAEAESYFARALAEGGLLLQSGWERPDARLNLATVHAARGEGFEALRWLGSAYEAGERNVLWIELNPMFGLIREEPGYTLLVARMEEDVDEMRRRVEREEQAVGGR